MRAIEQIKTDELKLCYDLVLEERAYQTLIELLNARIEELEFCLVNNSESDKGYDQYKRDASERIVLKGLLDMIQQGAELYNNKIKGATNE